MTCKKKTHLQTWFSQVDAETVGVPAVVLDQLLQGAEGGATGDEESALVQLSDAVVLDRVAVPHRQGVVVTTRLGITYEEPAVVILRQK